MHKLSDCELEPSSSSAEEEDLSDYTPIHRQPAKPVNAKLDAAKPQAPLAKQNARPVTPRKTEPAQNAPKAPATPNVEAAPVAKQATPKVEAAPVTKQATPAKQEGSGPDPTLALVPPVAPKIDKANKVKPKPAAPPLVPEHPTRTSERSNKRVPPQRLEFQSAILIITRLPILFGTALGQDVIKLPAYGALAEICGKLAMDEGRSLFSMIMRLENPKKITTNTKSCYDYVAAIMKEENEKQMIFLWMDMDIPTTVISTENNQNRKRRF